MTHKLESHLQIVQPPYIKQSIVLHPAYNDARMNTDRSCEVLDGNTCVGQCGELASIFTRDQPITRPLVSLDFFRRLRISFARIVKEDRLLVPPMKQDVRSLVEKAKPKSVVGLPVKGQLNERAGGV